MTKLLAFTNVSILVLMLPRIENPDTASLGGRVTDENLAAIPGATISITNVFSRDVALAKSDETGLYEITGLRQGRYSVFASAEDHGCTWVFNVFLYRGQHTRLDLQLRKSREDGRAVDCRESARKLSALQGSYFSR